MHCAFKGIIILTLVQLTKREVEFIVTTLLRVGELGTVKKNYYMNYFRTIKLTI